MGEEALGLTIACCLWGDWPGDASGVEYVNRLYRGVERNLQQPHRFVLMCDDEYWHYGAVSVAQLEPGIERIPLEPLSMEGCLPKLAVHRPDNGLTGRVLVFDLDSIIVGPIDTFAGYHGPFATRAWFGGIKKNIWLSGGDLLGFEAGSTSWIWDRFARDPGKVERWTAGRERFVYREWVGDDLQYWQRLLPGQLVSYKWHVRGEKWPVNARIVSCHGRPRPHELGNEPVKGHWR